MNTSIIHTESIPQLFPPYALVGDHTDIMLLHVSGTLSDLSLPLFVFKNPNLDIMTTCPLWSFLGTERSRYRQVWLYRDVMSHLASTNHSIVEHHSVINCFQINLLSALYRLYWAVSESNHHRCPRHNKFSPNSDKKGQYILGITLMMFVCHSNRTCRIYRSEWLKMTPIWTSTWQTGLLEGSRNMPQRIRRIEVHSNGEHSEIITIFKYFWLILGSHLLFGSLCMLIMWSTKQWKNLVYSTGSGGPST